ncbi:MAG: flagellar basal body L-ring protein FlgH [Pseudomonadota bacterium]
MNHLQSTPSHVRFDGSSSALSRLLAGVVGSLVLVACGSAPVMPEPEPRRYLEVTPAIPTASSNGSLFQPGAVSPLFSDLRAGRVGDILTVTLDEQTNATKSSSTSTSKSNNIDSATATIFGIPVTSGGNPIFNTSVDTSATFEGEGGASQSNTLQGSVAVQVIERLPNGNLVIEGEKRLTLNQGQEIVRVSGIVRPIDIEPGNMISSQKIANAQIHYGGRGALADANRMNWLARFFHSPWMPF